MIRIPMNVPNMLTMLRFALVPVTTIFIYFGMMIPALISYIVACGTDLLDGYIARKYKMITEEGTLLDPLADKLMAVFAVIAFTVTGVLPLFVLIIILAKECIMIAGGIFLYFRDIVTPSNLFGKGAAFLFNTSIALTFLHRLVSPWHVYVICFALALMIAALAQYTVINLKKMRARNKEATEE